MKRITAILLILCLCLGGTNTFANGDMTIFVSYNPANGVVSVSGTADGSVVISVIPSGVALNTISTANMPIYLKQIEAEGTYTLELMLPDSVPGDIYDVYAGSEVFKSFAYFKSDIANEYVGNLITAQETSDFTEFSKVISENEKDLGINYTDKTYLEDKDEIIGMLYKSSFEDGVEFNNLYAKYRALMAINDANVSDVEALLKEFQIPLGIDYEEDIKLENRLSVSAKQVLCEMLKGTDYSEKISGGDIDFAGFMDSIKSLSAVRGADSWLIVKKAIAEDFADEFSELLSNSKYKKISDKDMVYEEMMKNDLSSFENINSAFVTAVDNVYSSENKGNNFGGSSSGSGGGSGSNMNITTPSKLEDKSDNEPLAEIPSVDTGKTEEGKKYAFLDLDNSHWAYDAVEELVKKNVISGLPDGTFAPSREITRAEFIKMLIGFSTEMAEVESDISFSDVHEEDWYFEYVMKAAKYGVAAGSNGLFRPNELIKREDAALLVYRLLSKGNNVLNRFRIFTDRNDVSDYAKEAVNALGGAYIVNGDKNNMFMPAKSLTRAESAQLLYNAFVEYPNR